MPHSQPFAAARQIACRIRTYVITLDRLYPFRCACVVDLRFFPRCIQFVAHSGGCLIEAGQEPWTTPMEQKRSGSGLFELPEFGTHKCIEFIINISPIKESDYIAMNVTL